MLVHGLSETLGKGMTTEHLLVVSVPVSVPVFVPGFHVFQFPVVMCG